MSLRICHVWDYEYPWDVRIEKVCRALQEAGHEVHLTARNRHRRPVTEVMEEATVHRLTPTPWMGRTLEALAMFPAFLNPRWVDLVSRTARSCRADVLLVRDIPLGPTAVWVGHQMNIPVVLDMAENYGAMMRDLFDTGATGPVDLLVRNPKIVDAVEKWCLERMDHVVVVVEESRERLAGLGVPREAITVVSNTPPLERLDGGPSAAAARHGPGDPLVVVYLGIMEVARGVGELIDGVAEARRRGVDARLELIGDGRALPSFKERVSSLGIEDATTFHGFLDYSVATRLLQQAHIGVIPHHVKESWNSTIPNKLFDYMAAGIPVLASDAVPVVRVVEETGCGMIFKDRDSVDLAERLVQAANERDLDAMATNGRNAIQSRYNWQKDAGRLVQAIEGVVARKRMPLRRSATPR